MDVDRIDPAGSSTDQRRREIEELKFLVGTSCSRLINMLVDRETADADLAGEAAFIAGRAARLAELLEERSGGDQGGVGARDDA